MVEQLRREAAIKRINVSQAIEDIKVRGEKKNLVFSTAAAAAASLYLIFLLLDRSSYRITRTTIIFWWASHPKSLTRSGKNPLAA